MTPLEIILIVIGAGILLISCFLVDKNKEDMISSLVDQRELSLTETEDIKDKVETIISEVTEDSITKAEDKLSQISNEKIIAVNDFSNQVLEKISQNHEEVVFLYNMLNEKDSEIKDTFKNFDKVKKQLAEVDQSESPVVKSKEYPDNSSRKINHDSVADAVNFNTDTDFLNNHNQKILEMYSQGFSVVDISRTLELGQGEVKLVIDLYKEK